MTARSCGWLFGCMLSRILHDVLKLISGRWPDRLPPPHSRERTAITEAEQIAKGVGMYSRGDVEGVITSQGRGKDSLGKSARESPLANTRQSGRRQHRRDRRRC